MRLRSIALACGAGIMFGAGAAFDRAALAQGDYGGSFGGSFEQPVAPPPVPEATTEAADEGTLVRANDIAFVASELRRHGYETKLMPWKPDRPYVEALNGGLASQVFSGWCFPDRPSCLLLRFQLRLDMPTAPTAETLNVWNRDNIGARAFVGADGMTTLTTEIITGEDGLSREGFLRAADIWRMQVDAFADTVGFRR